MPLIGNTFTQTLITVGTLILLILLTLRRDRSHEIFSLRHTLVLKAIALLAVIANHVGYFLTTSPTFLLPFSNFAGIAVDVFLLLSGYGITMSWLSRPLRIDFFYRKRLSKIFIPVWISLAIFIALDYVVHHTTYSFTTIARYAIGAIPSADIYNSLNSPLWFLTLLIGYYLLFPLVFSWVHPKIAGVVLAAVGYGIIFYVPYPVHDRITELLQLHWLAFPLGTLLAAWHHASHQTSKLMAFVHHKTARIVALCGIGALLYLVYTYPIAQDSRLLVQLASLSLALLFSLFVNFIPFTSLTLEFIGRYSYELYLLHWPLLLRYDPLYTMMPTGAATILSLIILVGSSYCFSLIIKILTTRPRRAGVEK